MTDKCEYCGCFFTGISKRGMERLKLSTHNKSLMRHQKKCKGATGEEREYFKKHERWPRGPRS